MVREGDGGQTATGREDGGAEASKSTRLGGMDRANLLSMAGTNTIISIKGVAGGGGEFHCRSSWTGMPIHLLQDHRPRRWCNLSQGDGVALIFVAIKHARSRKPPSKQHFCWGLRASWTSFFQRIFIVEIEARPVQVAPRALI